MATEQSSGSEAEPVPPPTELTSYTARLQSAIIPPTRIAGALPVGNSLAYERTLDRAAAKELDAVSGRVLGLVDRLVQYAGGKGKGKALSVDDLLDSRGYRNVVGDVLDQLLENAVSRFVRVMRVVLIGGGRMSTWTNLQDVTRRPPLLSSPQLPKPLRYALQHSSLNMYLLPTSSHAASLRPSYTQSTFPNLNSSSAHP